MPRPKKSTVPAIFEKFVSSLGVLIKEKVAESVQAATKDFFAANLGKGTVKAEKKTRKRRRRRSRRKGTTKAKVAAEKPARG